MSMHFMYKFKKVEMPGLSCESVERMLIEREALFQFIYLRGFDTQDSVIVVAAELHVCGFVC